jgi:hypothetical protein
MKAVGIAIVAYVTLVCETVIAPTLPFQAPAACWAWLVLPWIAVTWPDGKGIAVAAVFGLSVDCLANGILGPGLCLSVLSTCAMQRFVSENSLRSAISVGLWTFTSCAVLSSVLCAIQLSARVIEMPVKSVAIRIAACSVIASLAAITLTSIGRVFLSRDATTH